MLYHFIISKLTVKVGYFLTKTATITDFYSSHQAINVATPASLLCRPKQTRKLN